MYNHSAGLGFTAAALPFTGLSLIYLVLAAFALLALGLALWRIAPRREA